MPVNESITVCSDDERAMLKRDITVVSCCRSNSNSRGGRQKDTDDGCAWHFRDSHTVAYLVVVTQLAKVRLLQDYVIQS